MISSSDLRNYLRDDFPIVAKVFASDATNKPSASDTGNLVWLCSGLGTNSIADKAGHLSTSPVSLTAAKNELTVSTAGTFDVTVATGNTARLMAIPLPSAPGGTATTIPVTTQGRFILNLPNDASATLTRPGSGAVTQVRATLADGSLFLVPDDGASCAVVEGSNVLLYIDGTGSFIVTVTSATSTPGVIWVNDYWTPCGRFVADLAAGTTTITLPTVGTAIINVLGPDATAINAAIASGAKVVELSPGTFSPGASLTMAAGVTLQGKGKSTVLDFGVGGIMSVDVDNTAAKNLKVTGAGFVECRATSANVDGWIVEDVNVEDTICAAYGAFTMYPTNPRTISNFRLTRCRADTVPTFGFSNVGTAGGSINDGRVNNFTAYKCGYNLMRSGHWVCGMDLAETANITNVIVDNPIVSYCYESGIHTESTPTKTGLTISNPISNNNGTAKLTATYGCGINVSGGTLIANPVTSSNAGAGIRIKNGVSLIGGSDTSSKYNLRIGDSSAVTVRGFFGDTATNEGLYLYNSYDLDIDAAFNNPAGGALFSHGLGVTNYPIYNAKLRLKLNNCAKPVCIRGYDISLNGELVSTSATKGIYLQSDYNISIGPMVMRCAGPTSGIYIGNTVTKPSTIKVFDTTIIDTQASPTLTYGVYSEIAATKSKPVLSNVDVQNYVVAATGQGNYRCIGRMTDVIIKHHNSDLFAAEDVTDSAVIWQQPINSTLIGAKVEVDEAFAAASLTDLDLIIGDGGNDDGILEAAPIVHSSTSVVARTTFNTRGDYFDTTGSVYKVAATDWTAKVTSAGANLNTLSAGQVTFYFTYDLF